MPIDELAWPRKDRTAVVYNIWGVGNRLGSGNGMPGMGDSPRAYFQTGEETKKYPM